MTWPLPRRFSLTTRAPAARAFSALPSVESLSKTTISASGRRARKSPITLAIVGASL